MKIYDDMMEDVFEENPEAHGWIDLGHSVVELGVAVAVMKPASEFAAGLVYAFAPTPVSKIAVVGVKLLGAGISAAISKLACDAAAETYEACIVCGNAIYQECAIIDRAVNKSETA